MRLALFLGSLLLALAIGIAALQTPSPRGPDTPAAAFSADRAMVDVREIAQRPHPVGSAEHDRVRDVLLGRMAALGLGPTIQSGPLSPEAIARLGRESGAPPVGALAANLVGVLPGRDPTAPAVLLMAHYDSAWNSPGAADDSAGVAAALEAVRAIRARGPSDRSLILLLTDAEELNLDGARIFFGDHPLRDRIGAVVNLEARGGGGRAMMFETGPDNAETIALFTRAALLADGGATSNSLAVLVYELMPNGTDFTIPRARGVAGVNLAFIGRPAQYHSPTSTPEVLDQGSVQHIGSLALETTDALLRAPSLPVATQNRVYADVLGRVFLGHTPAVGWALLVLTAALFALAFWGARHASRLSFADVGRGLLAGLWALSAGLVLTQAVRLLAGPLSSRTESADAYYVLLRRLPWMEAGTALTVLAVGLVALAGRETVGRRGLALVVAVAAILATVLGGFNPVILGAAVVALGLGLWSQGAPRTVWGAWLGLIALIGLLGLITQAAAPGAAFLFVWTTLLAALAAAGSALIGARLATPKALIPPALAVGVGGAWLVTLSHPVFLGIGMDLPGVLMLMGLLILMLVRPLVPAGQSRALAIGAAACLILACGLSIGAQVAEPAAAASVSAPS